MSTKSDPPKQVPFWVHFLSGGLAGTIGAVITCPLEVVKTRFQSSQYSNAIHEISFAKHPLKATGFHIKGTVNAVKTVYKQEGLLALWKGVGPTVVGVMPSRAIYFACYNKGKSVFTELNSGHETSLIHLLSAISAGVVTATATNPIWLVKTRIQLQSNATLKPGEIRYRNSFHCLSTVVRTEGVRALYQGLSASYLGAIEGTLQWVVYERLKKTLHEYKLAHRSASAAPHDPRSRSPRDWLEYFGIAAVSKLFAACTTYPHEVLRTRMRQRTFLADGTPKYAGLLHSARTILREEGVPAFYGGMTAHLMRVVPNSAIMFLCYEMFVHLFSVSVHHQTLTTE